LNASLQEDRGIAEDGGIASTPFSAEAGEQMQIEIHSTPMRGSMSTLLQGADTP
jgi:hypothetical protein